MNSPISSLFKTEEIPQDVNKKTSENETDINLSTNIITEKENQLLEIFRQFTNCFDFNLLINSPILFNELTDYGYTILLQHNFFGVLCICISQLSDYNQIISALNLLIPFSKISNDISLQITGHFIQTLYCYLNIDCSELHDLSLLLCKNLSSFPDVAHDFVYDDELIKNFSIIFHRPHHLNQKLELIRIYKNLAKVDIYHYNEFIQSIVDEEFMPEILSKTSTIKLLRYLGKKAGNDERLCSQLFITNLKEGLKQAKNKGKRKYIKNCLKFINIRCSNVLEASSYYELGFSDVFIELPNEFLYYVSLIFVWIFEKVPESLENNELLNQIFMKLNEMSNSGKYKEKISAIKLISKIICKRRDLMTNQVVFGIALDSLDLLQSNDFEAVCRILDLLIEICQWERNQRLSTFIDSILQRDVLIILEEIGNSCDESICERTQILYNIIVQQNEKDD